MNDLEEQLDNLDEQLLSYEPKIRWSLYITVALGILVMGWLFYLSDTLDELSAIEEQNTLLMSEISDNSPDVYHAKITRSTSAMIGEKNRTIVLENEKQTLLFEMSTKGGLLFDNRQYAKMLDLLLGKSVKLGLKIELMESVDTDKIFSGKIKQFKKLTITGIGSFPTIASFLTFIESQNTLVQIESVQIRSDEAKPRFTVVILYMGVAL